MIGHFEEKDENEFSFRWCRWKQRTFKKKKYIYIYIYKEVWKGVKKVIETINGGEKIEYGKDYMKIRFKSNDDLPLNKPIKLRLLAIIIRSVISENGKFYPELLLDDALYEL